MTAPSPPVATVADLLDRAATRSSGPAIVLPDERMTFPELRERAEAMARRLRGAGLEPGERVGLLHEDCIDSLAFVLGAARAGMVAVPVNGRYKAREIEHVVSHAGMRALVVDASFARALEEVSLPGGCRVVAGFEEPSFVAGGEAAGAGLSPAAVEPSQPVVILYTSGTTASPKGCVYSHAGLAAQAFAFAEAAALVPGDRYWTPLPFFHVSALVSLAATLAASCALVHVGRRFDPAVSLDQLERERCTVAFPAFETIWLPVLNEPRFSQADLSALRLVINVGTPGSLRRMQERLPGVPQVSAFGGTETGGFAALGRPDDPVETRLATSGRPLPGVELRAVDAEGADVPPGAVGELLMRGPTRFVRYHDDPEQTALAIDADGWFHSGDLGRIDPDGRVAFVGRLKDMLKVGGENVAAAEVETFLLTHPAVEIAQVVAAPDGRYVEVPAAFVQLRDGSAVTEQELIDFCLGSIATFKVPRYVRFVTEWPMSGTKIQKFRLRERIAAELEERGVTEAPKLVSGGRT